MLLGAGLAKFQNRVYIFILAMFIRQLTRCFFWVIACVSIYHPSAAQSNNQRAYVLFLYSFTKYVQWPSAVIKDEFVIGVYGKDAIERELVALAATKKAGELPIRILEVTSNEELSSVHLLYVPAKAMGQWDQVLAAVKGLPVLVVCEQDGTVTRGACVSFLSIGQDVLRFELNKEAISAHALKVSKNLESLAYKRS